MITAKEARKITEEAINGAPARQLEAVCKEIKSHAQEGSWGIWYDGEICDTVTHILRKAGYYVHAEHGDGLHRFTVIGWDPDIDDKEANE